MKLIQAVVRYINMAALTVVVYSMLLVLLLPGFFLTLIGFYFIMFFFWVGERMNIFAVGTYNGKHDLLKEVMGPFRELLRMVPFIKR